MRGYGPQVQRTVVRARTPSAKADALLKSIAAIELGKLVVAELIQRSGVDGKEVQALVFGTVEPRRRQLPSTTDELAPGSAPWCTPFCTLRIPRGQEPARGRPVNRLRFHDDSRMIHRESSAFFD